MEASKPGKRFRSFEDRIEWAAANEILTPTEKKRWNAVRNIRNWGAHSDGQTILLPGQAIESLYVAAELIERLFPE
ncbi:MAG: hypothetical protein B0A82_12835 [Alkalinema sp. CACIAM 70d]|nr:MAG: hypothetical protein B0A82_12835 [Alkalinema sp. CACIAM 70d]